MISPQSECLSCDKAPEIPPLMKMASSQSECLSCDKAPEIPPLMKMASPRSKCLSCDKALENPPLMKMASPQSESKLNVYDSLYEGLRLKQMTMTIQCSYLSKSR